MSLPDCLQEEVALSVGAPGDPSNLTNRHGGRYPSRWTMLTVKQTAERLGVSQSLVYGLCAAGRIRHERHGLGRGTIRIPESALDEYRTHSTVAGAGGGATQPPARVKLSHIRL